MHRRRRPNKTYLLIGEYKYSGGHACIKVVPLMQQSFPPSSNRDLDLLGLLTSRRVQTIERVCVCMAAPVDGDLPRDIDVDLSNAGALRGGKCRRGNLRVLAECATHPEADDDEAKRKPNHGRGLSKMHFSIISAQTSGCAPSQS